ncbi:MAG: PEP-CTERM sorting domain-containing protein [Sedimentisphaerales bacterium]
MSKHVIVLFLACLFLTVPAAANPGIVQSVDVNEVSEIDNLAVNSSFDAVTGTLTWSKGGIATMYYDSGNQKYRVNVDATLSGITDNSSGGLASASFSSGTFTVNFYALTDGGKTNSLGHLDGELYPGYSYLEGEIQENPSQLYGAVPMRLTDFDFNGYAWFEGLGAMGGLTATTSNLFGNWGNISNYQSPWSSNNTVVRILADETGIPEPASILLLGLGGLALIRKRRA